MQVIAFWFEYLTRQRLADREDVLLVPGSISYLLANSGEHGTPVARFTPLMDCLVKALITSAHMGRDLHLQTGGRML